VLIAQGRSHGQVLHRHPHKVEIGDELVHTASSAHLVIAIVALRGGGGQGLRAVNETPGATVDVGVQVTIRSGEGQPCLVVEACHRMNVTREHVRLSFFILNDFVNAECCRRRTRAAPPAIHGAGVVDAVILVYQAHSEIRVADGVIGIEFENIGGFINIPQAWHELECRVAAGDAAPAAISAAVTPA